MTNKHAFTIIELLMVIAIIGVIAALLMPAIGKARESGRRTQCTNNLRQIGIAMYIYIDEHDSRFPPVVDVPDWWFHLLEPYLDDLNVWKCPSYKEHNYGDTIHFSYGFNYWGLNDVTGGWHGKHINAVTSPSQCIMISDGGRHSSDPADMSRCYIYKNSYMPSPRHSNGTNILFVGGHVKWHRIVDIPISGGDDLLWWNY
jgi:prepilin-type N-terminal cleavage/methylation domain-containing protein/prepilin-type processing-associated H-X9-DG protein